MSNATLLEVSDVTVEYVTQGQRFAAISDVTLDIDVTVEATSPPVVDEIVNQEIDEDEGPIIIPFNVASNTAAVYSDVILSNISNGGSNYVATELSGSVDNGYTLTITPDEHWNGTFDVQVEIANGASNSDTENFSVTVNEQDDAPSLDMLAITVNEDNQGGGPFEHFLYLYDVDTDTNLNHVDDIDTYNSTPFDVSLDSNDNISSSDQGTQILPHPTSGENSLGFSYHFEKKNIFFTKNQTICFKCFSEIRYASRQKWCC